MLIINIVGRVIALSQDFPTLIFQPLLTFVVREFLVVGNCSVHCRMFSSIPGLDPLVPVPKVVTNKSVSRHCHVYSGGQRITPVENYCPRGIDKVNSQ